MGKPGRTRHSRDIYVLEHGELHESLSDDSLYYLLTTDYPEEGEEDPYVVKPKSKAELFELYPIDEFKHLIQQIQQKAIDYKLAEDGWYERKEAFVLRKSLAVEEFSDIVQTKDEIDCFEIRWPIQSDRAGMKPADLFTPETLSWLSSGVGKELLNALELQIRDSINEGETSTTIYVNLVNEYWEWNCEADGYPYRGIPNGSQLAELLGLQDFKCNVIRPLSDSEQIQISWNRGDGEAPDRIG